MAYQSAIHSYQDVKNGNLDVNSGSYSLQHFAFSREFQEPLNPTKKML